MIIAEVKCDNCGKMETMNYVSKAVLEVLLRQKGWIFKEKKNICRVCNMNEKEINDYKFFINNFSMLGIENLLGNCETHDVRL